MNLTFEFIIDFSILFFSQKSLEDVFPEQSSFNKSNNKLKTFYIELWNLLPPEV